MNVVRDSTQVLNFSDDLVEIQAKKKKNRASAKKTRRRKKIYMEILE